MHAQFLFQRVEFFALGEQLALHAGERCADPFGAGALRDQLFEGLSGVRGNGALKVQGGVAIPQGVGVFVLPDLCVANHASSL